MFWDLFYSTQVIIYVIYFMNEWYSKLIHSMKKGAFWDFAYIVNSFWEGFISSATSSNHEHDGFEKYSRDLWVFISINVWEIKKNIDHQQNWDEDTTGSDQYYLDYKTIT